MDGRARRCRYILLVLVFILLSLLFLLALSMPLHVCGAVIVPVAVSLAVSAGLVKQKTPVSYPTSM